MKFFKHFTDARSGTSMRAIRRELGMAGIGQWWSLVEACAEKLEKRGDEEYTAAHCEFRFDVGVVAEILGTKPGRVQDILGTFQEHSLLSFSTDEFIIRISMPKLLESLDRDSRRARHERGRSAPKNKKEEKEKEEELAFSSSRSAEGVFGEPTATVAGEAIDFVKEAEWCFMACRRFQAYQGVDARLWLGEWRWSYLHEIGGLKFVRELKQNAFELRRLADLIRTTVQVMDDRQRAQGAS